MVASITMAAAVPMPKVLRSTRDTVAKIENTATMIRAALVTTPALDAIPLITASRVVAPRSRCSRIRLRKLAGHQAGLLQPVEVHVKQRP